MTVPDTLKRWNVAPKVPKAVPFELAEPSSGLLEKLIFPPEIWIWLCPRTWATGVESAVGPDNDGLPNISTPYPDPARPDRLRNSGNRSGPAVGSLCASANRGIRRTSPSTTVIFVLVIYFSGYAAMLRPGIKNPRSKCVERG